MQLKFPRISSEQDDELKALVYAAEAKLTDDIEEEINRAVFNIYGLDDDEISVIRKRLGKLCKIRNFSQSPFGGFISEESDGNFPSGRN